MVNLNHWLWVLNSVFILLASLRLKVGSSGSRDTILKLCLGYFSNINSDVIRRCSYHSGKYKGFRNAPPGAQDKDQLQIASLLCLLPNKLIRSLDSFAILVHPLILNIHIIYIQNMFLCYPKVSHILNPL